MSGVSDLIYKSSFKNPEIEPLGHLKIGQNLSLNLRKQKKTVWGSSSLSSTVFPQK